MPQIGYYPPPQGPGPLGAGLQGAAQGMAAFAKIAQRQQLIDAELEKDEASKAAAAQAMAFIEERRQAGAMVKGTGVPPYAGPAEGPSSRMGVLSTVARDAPHLLPFVRAELNAIDAANKKEAVFDDVQGLLQGAVDSGFLSEDAGKAFAQEFYESDDTDEVRARITEALREGGKAYRDQQAARQAGEAAKVLAESIESMNDPDFIQDIMDWGASYKDPGAKNAFLSGFNGPAGKAHHEHIKGLNKEIAGLKAQAEQAAKQAEVQRLIQSGAGEAEIAVAIDELGLELADWQRAAGFDPTGAGYDYESAKAAGLAPDASGHWPSRTPEGLILKGTGHPTWDKTVAGEKEAGYEIYDKGGRKHSRKKEVTGIDAVFEAILREKMGKAPATPEGLGPFMPGAGEPPQPGEGLPPSGGAQGPLPVTQPTITPMEVAALTSLAERTDLSKVEKVAVEAALAMASGVAHSVRTIKGKATELIEGQTDRMTHDAVAKAMSGGRMNDRAAEYMSKVMPAAHAAIQAMEADPDADLLPSEKEQQKAALKIYKEVVGEDMEATGLQSAQSKALAVIMGDISAQDEGKREQIGRARARFEKWLNKEAQDKLKGYTPPEQEPPKPQSRAKTRPPRFEPPHSKL